MNLGYFRFTYNFTTKANISKLIISFVGDLGKVISILLEGEVVSPQFKLVFFQVHGKYFSHCRPNTKKLENNFSKIVFFQTNGL